MAKKKKKASQLDKKKAEQQSVHSMIRDTYRLAQKQVAGSAFSNPALKAGLDFDTVRTQRRIKATENYAEQVKQRVLATFPELAGFDIYEDWAQVNAAPRTAYDAEEDMHTVTMAIAIWMLDRLRDAGKIEKARAYLSTDAQRLSEINAPYLWDPCHSEELILGMMEVIQSRNDDCISRKKAGDTENEPPRLFMDICTAENTHKQDVPSRNRFEGVLKLIPEEQKEKAAQEFTDTFWDWLNRYYRCRRIYALREIQLDADYRIYEEKAENSIHLLTNYMIQAKQPKPENLPVFSPDAFSSPTMQVSPFPLGNPAAEAMRLAMQLDAEQEKLDARSEAIQDSVSDLWFYLRTLYETSYEDSVERVGKEVADIWEDFHIDDPYELSFGFLYLLDNDTDLPWLYFPGVNLFAWIAASLPWTHMDFDHDDELWEELTETLEESGTEGTSLPKKIKVPELENWYRMEYCDETSPDIDRDKYNLAQIMYQITGGIMPRRPERYLSMLEELGYYGITGKKALHPLYYCMSILGEASHQTRHSQPELQEPTEEQAEKSKADAKTPEELEREIVSLRRENEQLKNTLYHTGSELRSMKKKQEAASEQISQERQELADLRELVFHQQEGIYQDEKQTTDITFPFHTTQRIVVFGGHDSWAREIKPKLPDVRFVDRTVLPNANMIRNADVVWIQTNALSHAYFYKIIDEVRKHNVPVRYFSYASAVKCAEQVALMDQDR